jgi:hypothetical protein
MSIEHSRALLLGASATGADEETLKARLESALVVVRADPAVHGALLTARVLLTTLRRLPGRVVLDRSGLDEAAVGELVSAVRDIDSTRPLLVVDVPPANASVRIHLGPVADAGWVRVVPDGYGAQLANDPTVVLRIARKANALGSVFAAALAAAEAFKHTAGVLPDRRTDHRHLTFCPVTLTTDTALAPELPDSFDIDLALVGNGAIGTAEALILGEFRFGGRIIVCDPERYGPENRGTYSLGGEREGKEEPPKVDLVGDWLSGAGYDVNKVEGPSTEMTERIEDGKLAAPRVVLTGLDSVEARRETQGLWPDHLIDAQTGDTSLGFAHAVPDGPCLRCFFPERHDGPSPLLLVSQKTGLPIERLKRGTEALTEDELADLTDEQRALLHTQLGKPVCGLANALGLTSTDAAGYMPSVPFVSQMAACLGIGRLLALLMGLDTTENFLQFDALHGPHTETEARVRDPNCICQTHPSVVRKLRELRRAA